MYSATSLLKSINFQHHQTHAKLQTQNIDAFSDVRNICKYAPKFPLVSQIFLESLNASMFCICSFTRKETCLLCWKYREMTKLHFIFTFFYLFFYTIFLTLFSNQLEDYELIRILISRGQQRSVFLYCTEQSMNECVPRSLFCLLTHHCCHLLTNTGDSCLVHHDYQAEANC